MMSFLQYRLAYKAFDLLTFPRLLPGTFSVLQESLFRRKSRAKITILTFTVFPQLARIWHHVMLPVFAELKKAGYDNEVIMVDCCGDLKSGDFPGVRIVRFINFRHYHKLDYFVRHFTSSGLVWLSDDDCFVFASRPIAAACELFEKDPKLAAYSLHPRPEWKFNIAGVAHRPMGSYSVLVRPGLIKKMGLTFTPSPAHNPHNGRGYDTCDNMNESFLTNGYAVGEIGEKDKDEMVSCLRAGSSWKPAASCLSKPALKGFFQNPANHNITLRYTIGSFYTAAHVSEICNELFRGESWSPVFTREELLGFTKKINDPALRDYINEEYRWADEAVLNFWRLYKEKHDAIT
ncbi:MAG: hypothetical protein Q7U71_08030 [bacterium]|nr:hypothetical protein [bacterium]